MKKTLFSPSSYLVTCLLLLLLTAQLRAQSPKMFFEEYGVAEGLPEETVGAVIQDDQGFIWFTTQPALVKYDGYDFEVYRNEEKAGEVKIGFSFSFTAGALLQSSDRKIWMASSGGLVCYDPIAERFQNYLHTPDSTTSLPFQVGRPILEDSKQDIWFVNSAIAEDTAVICRLNPNKQQISVYPYICKSRFRTNNFSINGSLVASNLDSSVWLLDRQSNLWKWTPEVDSFEIISAPGQALSSQGFRDSLNWIYPTREGHILMAGKQGLYVWDPLEMKFAKRYLRDTTNAQRLLPDQIGRAFQDAQGHYWVLYRSGNATRIDPQKGTFTDYRLGVDYWKRAHDPESITSLTLNDMNAEGIWFDLRPVGNGYLHYRFATQSFQYYDHNFNAASNQLPRQGRLGRFMVDHSGLIWMGSRPNLYKEAPKRRLRELYTHDPDQPKGLPSNYITHLYEDRAGTFWAGTDQGLARFDFASNQFEVFQPNPAQAPPLKGHVIIRLLEDKAGNLWIGTSKGLFKWSPTERRLRSITFLKDAYIFGLMQDKDQRLWVSADRKGVYVLETGAGKRLKEFIHDPHDSTTLAATTVKLQIFQDSRDQIWIGGYRQEGVALYRLKEDESSLIPYVRRANDTASVALTNIGFIKEDSKGLYRMTCRRSPSTATESSRYSLT